MIRRDIQAGRDAARETARSIRAESSTIPERSIARRASYRSATSPPCRYFPRPGMGFRIRAEDVPVSAVVVVFPFDPVIPITGPSENRTPVPLLQSPVRRVGAPRPTSANRTERPAKPQSTSACRRFPGVCSTTGTRAHRSAPAPPAGAPRASITRTCAPRSATFRRRQAGSFRANHHHVSYR